MRMRSYSWRPWGRVMLLIAVSGCRTTSTVPVSAVEPEIAGIEKARGLLLEKRYNEALLALAEEARRDPAAPAVEALRTRILGEMTASRRAALEGSQAEHRARMELDAWESARVPDTYGRRRLVESERLSHRGVPTAAEAMLALPISLNLEGADLPTLLMALGQSGPPDRPINLVADEGLAGGRAISLAVTNVPLREVLEYAARNLDVSFYVGDSLIWVTRRTSAVDPVPLETRLFRLKKGVSALAYVEPTAMNAIRGGGTAALAPGGARGGAGGGGTAGAGGGGRGARLQDFGLLEAIERFVPQTQGADLLFDPDTHTLLVKNTRENLRLIEELVDAFDVTPPQVLIEARFITTSLSDLRELGVNWTMSDLYFKKDGITRATLSNLGLTPGKVGDMTAGDMKRPTPSVAGTLAYQGVLTSPMFEVMLQALEQSGKAQTLSVPRVTTLNNQPAKIWEGRELRYFERFTTVDVVTSVTDNRENRASRLVPTGQPSREELGYKLEVTPSVGADRQTIVLSLAPEISDLSDWVYYESADVETSVNNRTTNTLGMVKLPIFIKRQIVTKVAVRSGETVVMGGLINSTDQKDVRRVPLLGSLPLIGALFRYEVVNKSQRNLLIFVTARVLAETGEELVPIESSGQGGGGT